MVSEHLPGDHGHWTGRDATDGGRDGTGRYGRTDGQTGRPGQDRMGRDGTGRTGRQTWSKTWSKIWARTWSKTWSKNWLNIWTKIYAVMGEWRVLCGEFYVRQCLAPSARPRDLGKSSLTRAIWTDQIRQTQTDRQAGRQTQEPGRKSGQKSVRPSVRPSFPGARLPKSALEHLVTGSAKKVNKNLARIRTRSKTRAGTRQDQNQD